ncbi:MAG: UDP-N-acetylmuramate dehydrogenase [Patescibacteria group bacterium]
MQPITDQQIKDFKDAFPAVLENESMGAHTSLKIGGPSRLYFVAKTADEVVAAISKARELQIPWFVFGGGSNLLVSDDGYEGVIIQVADRTVEIQDTKVKAAAGAFTSFVSQVAADAGLTGFEWGATMPGTIGGAVFGDAGCYGGEMRDIVSSVEVYDVKNSERKVLSNADCKFDYRDSRFKHEPFIILFVTLKLQPGDKAKIKATIQELMEKRKKSQPQGEFSAGCLFKNFVYIDESALDILKRQGDEIPTDMLGNKRIAAGWLIDKLGLKGQTIGKAQVSQAHGNFLVNLGGARAQDVLALSSLVKMKVRDELGIMLEDEIQYLGF